MYAADGSWHTTSVTALDSGFHLITPVWGEDSTRCFVDVCLPALLAPGNVPALPDTGNCVYNIYARAEDRNVIKASAAYRRLARYLPVNFHPIDTIAGGGANPYLMQSEAYRDGIRRAGAACAAIVFLDADMVLADGGLRSLVRLVSTGKRAIFATTPLTGKDAVMPHLIEKYRSADGAVLSIEPRELVGLAVPNLHPAARTHFYHGEGAEWQPAALLWRAGDDGLLARCFHLHPVVIHPRKKNASFSVSIDDDYPLAACPDAGDAYAIPDSDEFFACRLGGAARRVRTMPRTGDRRDIARWAYFNANKTHRGLVKQVIRIHRGRIDTEAWRAAEQESGEVVAQVLRDLDDPALFGEEKQGSGFGTPGTGAGYLPLHFVTPVWGREYSELFVNVTLPTILSPGNIPAVPNKADCRYLIYTDSAGRGIIEQSPAYAILRGHVRAEIHLIDETRGNKYDTSSNCYRDAIRGAARQGAAAVFLIPDMILADGSIRNIAHILRSGKRQILITGTRVVKETVVPGLMEKRSADGVISIAPGELIRLALDHIHPITRTHFYEGDTPEFHPAVMCWQAGRQGFVLRCFHLHPVAVVPGAGSAAFEGTIDDDLLENSSFDPKDTYIVTDSNEIQWCEMSPLGRTVPSPLREGVEGIVGWIINSTNVFHRSLIHSTIRVHTGSCRGPEWDAAEARAQRAVQMVMTCHDARTKLMRSAGSAAGAAGEKTLRTLLPEARVLVRELISVSQRYLARKDVLHGRFPLSVLYLAIAGAVVAPFLALRSCVRLVRAVRGAVSTLIHRCKLCRSGMLREIVSYSSLPRVTSDTKPWPAGGHIAVCKSCGAIQKIPDSGWKKEIADIYREYQSYPLSGGLEQSVYDPASGAAQRRSFRIAGHLIGTLRLPEKGSILDLGCGNGVTLDAFSRLRPSWELYGQDLGDKSLPVLRKLPGFKTLYTGTPDSIRGQHTIVSLVHAFEHFPDPRSALQKIRHLIAEDGWLFIEVPDCRSNPFDLVVADHLLHFTLDSLALMVEAAGYEVRSITDTLVPKELSLVARPSTAGPHRIRRGAGAGPESSARMLIDHLDWLRVAAADAERIAESGAFGLFGTAIAATWLFGIIGQHVGFFVDEDPNRVGNRYMGRPVLSPDEIPGGAHVYLPLAPAVADSVYRRLSHLPVFFHLPPPLNSG